jgi:hypothetical protein
MRSIHQINFSWLIFFNLSLNTFHIFFKSMLFWWIFNSLAIELFDVKLEVQRVQ